MRYDERVVLIHHERQDDFLGERLVDVASEPLPCKRGALTNEEQLAVFGTYDLKAFKLYLQGHHGQIDLVRYGGQDLAVKAVKHHRLQTVIYL